MPIPTTVTRRAQNNDYVGSTGMEFAVQTGHAIRTGFYLTNSGDSAMTLSITTQNVYDAFHFLSGLKENISINPGTTKFIPFDFYGYKPVSGPYFASTGPAGTGNYETSYNLYFSSQENGRQDPNGYIRLDLTGYVTGYYGRDGVEFEPSRPSGFLVKTNEYSQNGLPKNSLYWKHPATGYYFDKYQLQYSEDGTSSWSDLTTLTFEQKLTQTNIDGINFYTYIYGTPTGLIGNQTYTHEGLEFSKDYYYRIRGEHYEPLLRTELISSSDWVYGYPVTDFNQNVTNTDVLGGLVSGSATLLDNTINPNGIINCTTQSQQALKIYFSNLEENINLKSKFDTEIARRSITLDVFDSSNTSAYAFTGVHFILPQEYIVGSTNSLKAGIETGDKIVDASDNEIKTILFLNKNSTVAGMGGRGGDGGYVDIQDVGINSDNRYLTVNKNGIPQLALSTEGSNGTDAIKITDSSIANFEIHADYTSKIYGGGGGGGGGDSTYLVPILEAIQLETFANLQNNGDDISLDLLTPYRYSQGMIWLKIFYSTTISLKKEDLMGVLNAGVGGGGRSFKLSSGGTLLYSDQQILANNGDFFSQGKGTTANLKNKISDGGDGGDFGQDGESPTDYWLRSFSGLGDSNSKKAGYAGYGINCLGNSNYSKSNFRSNLFFIRKYVNPSDIRGFVCRWDSSNYTYNNYGTTTLATNGQRIQRWNSVEYDSNLLSQPYIQGSNNSLNDSRSPIWLNTSTEEFNGNPYVAFYDDNYALFKNIVDNTFSDDLLFNNNMGEFDVFYNIRPYYSSTPQFDFETKRHKENNYILHLWSDAGDESQFSSQFYSKTGKISETLGLKQKQLVGTDYSYIKENAMLFDSSFVYNISSQKISKQIMNYKVYSNTEVAIDYDIFNSSYDFINDPILGSPKSLTYTSQISGESKTVATPYVCNFCISEIILYNKKLNSSERHNVLSYLINKYRRIKTVNDSELQAIITIKDATKELVSERDKNNIFEKTNIAGYVTMET
jgi:hypothetical protein